MIWSERHGDELYVFHNGVLVYKKWFRTGYSRVFAHWFEKR